MKGLKKVCAVALSLSMLGTVGITGVQAEETKSSDGSEEIKKVVFSEDFENLTVGETPATIGGATQGNLNDDTKVVQDGDGNKALSIGGAAETSQDIMLDKTYSGGVYEISYKLKAKNHNRFAKEFMRPRSSENATATYIGLADYNLWFEHSGLGMGSRQADGAWLKDDKYVDVSMKVDFEAKSGWAQTVDADGRVQGLDFAVNISDINALHTQFSNGGAPGHGDTSLTAQYYIDDLKVTQIYKLIDNLPIEDGAVFENTYTLPEITPSADGVTYVLSYTKDGETVELNAGDVLGKGRYTVTINASDGENTAVKTISFAVKPDVTYTDESEVVFSEDFESLTVGETPAAIGGATQGKLDADTKVVQDGEENKALSIGGGQTAAQDIMLDRVYSGGVYKISYKLKAKNHNRFAKEFMRPKSTTGDRATYNGLAVNYFWYEHSGIGMGTTMAVNGANLNKDNYIQVAMKVDFENKKVYNSTVQADGTPANDWNVNLNISDINSLHTQFSTEYGNPIGNGDVNQSAQYYIDDLKIEQYYGLAVELPFKTGNIYNEGYKVPEVKPADGVEYAVTYTKDGAAIELTEGDKLEVGNYTMTVNATDGFNTETRTVKFAVVPVVKYTDEYEVVLDEDFSGKTVGEKPDDIGGAAQNLSMSTVVSDNGNNVLSIKGNNGQEYISLGRDVRNGKYDVSYKFKVVNHSTVVSEFMRLADSNKKFASYELLTPGAFWFARSDSGYPAAGFNSYAGGLSSSDYTSYKYEINGNFFKPRYNDAVTPGTLGSSGVKSYDGLLTTLNSNGRGDFKGSGSGDNEIYIDDIKVIEYYGLAVNLPFKTGETYRAGTAVPTLNSAAGVEYTSVTYTKDGEQINLAAGDKLTVGEYTMTVVATDGYNTETRTVKFDVTDEFGVISATTLDNGEKITARVELSIPDSFTDDFDVIVVMKSADKISDIKSVNRKDLQNEAAVFTFDTPAEESYEFEYFVWDLATLKPYTEKGVFTTLDPSL